MDKTYSIENCRISVSLKEHIVQITGDQELLKLLSVDKEARTLQLVQLIKNDYFDLYQKELQITDDSLIVEIWGHVWFEYFTLAIKKLFELKVIDYFADFVVKRSGLIDCGEEQFDNNRIIWDKLAQHKNFIAKILPQNIEH